MIDFMYKISSKIIFTRGGKRVNLFHGISNYFS